MRTCGRWSGRKSSRSDQAPPADLAPFGASGVIVGHEAEESALNQQDYWAIAEADIEIQNPVTDRKLRLLDDYCDIRDGLRVLDVGCGKAWLLRQWAEKHAI